MIPLPVITGLVGAALAFAAAWTWQANSYTTQISNLQRAQALAALKSLERAHAETNRLQDRKDNAERLAATRQSALAAASAAVRDERDRLRDELNASTMRLPDSSCSSVRQYAATLGAVFGECAAEAGGLAEKAGGHAIDALKLIQAWPTKEDHGTPEN